MDHVPHVIEMVYLNRALPLLKAEEMVPTHPITPQAAHIQAKVFYSEIPTEKAQHTLIAHLW